MKLGLPSASLGALTGVVAVCAVGVGWMFWQPVFERGSEEVSAPQGNVTPAPAPEPAASPIAVAAPAVPSVAEPVATAPAAAPPRFDTFRLSEDGTAVVAGVASGARDVAILVDRLELASAKPDANGRFAAVLSLPASTEAREMVLLSRFTDGAVLASAETILIAGLPAAEPPKVEAEPAAAPSVALASPPTAPTAQAALEVANTQPSADSVAQASPALAPPDAVPSDPAPEAAQPNLPSPIVVTDLGARKLGALVEGDIAIDTITYATSGGVAVSGRARAGSDLRLYLNNDPQTDVSVDAAGQWRGELAGVKPGLYALRADQIDAAGKVVARAETPFLRESPEALAATPVAQGRAAQVVTVQPGFTLWGIAKESYGDGTRYVKVFEANRAQIRNADLIYPGQIFNLPE